MKDEVQVDFDGQLAALIFTVAQWQVKCVAQGTSAVEMRITADVVREAADLVFFAMDLIEERKRG